MRPTKGKGERFLGCDYYEDCLSRAALENWPSWNCESCDLFKTLFPGGKSKVSEEDKKSENPRMCKECGIRPTIQPNSPYCSVCLALKAKEARARKKEAIDKTPKGTKSNQEDSAALKTAKRPTQTIGQGEIVDPGRNMSFIFQGKHAYLLEEIERLAEEEVRTIEEQIIYILKSYLSK
jgi:hypothetical protein